ncbi:uncharacterized protein LOC135848820 [Planococcus citri]|uniref:uncharacterized protein LOC135848820 n=1 Tax=Planococcus citri TaxID=170843 RepID=UPI0031F9E074
MTLMAKIPTLFTALVFIGAMNLSFGRDQTDVKKLIDLDSSTRAQVYAPTQADLDTKTRAQIFAPGQSSLSSFTNLLPPVLQNLLPTSKNGYPSAPLPLFYTPQAVNVLSNDIFNMANHLLTLFNNVLGLPSNINIPDQIARLEKLIREGQIPQEYMPYATSFLSLLRDQPVLRALEQSVSELQRSTTFNLSTSGQGINNFKLNTDFNLPATLITPSIQSSFGFDSNPDNTAKVTKPSGKVPPSSSADVDDEDPFIYE